MNITTKKENTTLTVALEGRLDTTTAPELEKALQAADASVTELILDFAGLAYVSSAGLRVLLTTQKKMNKQGKMIIRNVCDRHQRNLRNHRLLRHPDHRIKKDNSRQATAMSISAGDKIQNTWGGKAPP